MVGTHMGLAIRAQVLRHPMLFNPNAKAGSVVVLIGWVAAWRTLVEIFSLSMVLDKG
jgi:hypothetical protein